MMKHAQMLALFGSTFICEQTFSVRKLNKSIYRTSLWPFPPEALNLTLMQLFKSQNKPDFSLSDREKRNRPPL